MERILDAIHETAINSPVSAKVIAENMVMGHQVFLNKANPRSQNDVFTVDQLCALVFHSKSPVIGQEFQRLSETPGSSIDLLTAVLVAGTEQGHLREVLLEVNADGVITSREARQVIARLNDVRKALDDIEATVVAHSEGVS